MCQPNEKGLTHLQEVSCALLRQSWWKPSFFKQVKAIKKNCDARWDLTHSYLLIYLHPQHQLNTECFNQLHMLLITDDDDVLLPSCHPELDWFYTLSINSATLSKILLPLLQVQVSQSILLVMGIDEISSITVPLSAYWADLSCIPLLIVSQFSVWKKTGVCTGFWQQYNCFIVCVNTGSKQRRKDVVRSGEQNFTVKKHCFILQLILSTSCTNSLSVI